jgi:predicted nucleotide-binding protein
VLRKLGVTADQIRRQTRRILNESAASTSNIPSYGDIQARSVSQVLLIYGQDLEAKQAVENYVESLGLQVNSLNANSFTPIEISAAKVVFGIILLTPDDKVVSASDPQQTRFRAGQNVIYEFGFFHGTLGPNRVCALFKSNHEVELELPADALRGSCVRLDAAGEWKGWLARQMREAGLTIKSENIK